MRSRDVTAAAAFLAILILPPALAQPSRLASDFEIAQMERQIERSSGFEAQVSGRLNLGDLRATRNERTLAETEYRKALEVAQRERLASRGDSNLSRYSVATSYAGLAEAKLGRSMEAFLLIEESIRYMSGDAATWNLYASAMRALGRPDKAVSAARNAVTIASTGGDTVRGRLDLAVYQYGLATFLIESGKHEEAESLLLTVDGSLRSPEFSRLSREVVRQEAFEIYSSARGDVAAYVSLMNRAQLRLAALYEGRGETARAREQYELVLQGRSDDVTALSALARLTASERDRARHYAEAFESNPFSPALVGEYRRWLRDSSVEPRTIDGSSPGTRMRRALATLQIGDRASAREILDSLATAFPGNETIVVLQREAEATPVQALPSPEPAAAELRTILQGYDMMTPQQRLALDAMTFTNQVAFDSRDHALTTESQTLLAAGLVHGIPFRFVHPTLFAGTFEITDPLRLTYQILGVTRAGGRPVLLLEPVRLEAIR